MTKRRTDPKKLNRNAKIAIAALTTTAMIGGWNAIGHLEATTSQAMAAESAVVTELIAPTPTWTVQSTPIVLPAIPALEIAPIATLPAMNNTIVTDVAGEIIAPAAALTIQPLAALAPLPTMAPLPDLPSMPAPPPPPSNNQSSGGGGKSSGGS